MEGADLRGSAIVTDLLSNLVLPHRLQFKLLDHSQDRILSWSNPVSCKSSRGGIQNGFLNCASHPSPPISSHGHIGPSVWMEGVLYLQHPPSCPQEEDSVSCHRLGCWPQPPARSVLCPPGQLRLRGQRDLPRPQSRRTPCQTSPSSERKKKKNK